MIHLYAMLFTVAYALAIALYPVAHVFAQPDYIDNQ